MGGNLRKSSLFFLFKLLTFTYLKYPIRAPQQNHSQQSQHQSNESLNRSGSRSNNNSFELPPPGNPFSGNASLRSGFNGASHSNNMDMRPSNNQRKPELVKSQLANINQLLQMGSQMLTSANVSNDHNHHQSSSRFRDEHGEIFPMDYMVEFTLNLRITCVVDDRASSNSEHSTTRPYRRNQSSYRRDNDPYDNNRRHNNDRGQHQNRDRNNRNAGSGSGRHRY